MGRRLLLQLRRRLLLLFWRRLLSPLQFGDAVLYFLLLLALRLTVHLLHLLHVLVDVGVPRHPQHPPLDLIDLRTLLSLRLAGRPGGQQHRRLLRPLPLPRVAAVEPDSPLPLFPVSLCRPLSSSLVGVVVVG